MIYHPSSLHFGQVYIVLSFSCPFILSNFTVSIMLLLETTDQVLLLYSLLCLATAFCCEPSWHYRVHGSELFPLEIRAMHLHLVMYYGIVYTVPERYSCNPFVAHSEDTIMSQLLIQHTLHQLLLLQAFQFPSVATVIRLVPYYGTGCLSINRTNVIIITRDMN